MSTGACVHADWPRISRPANVVAQRRLESRPVAGEITRAQEPARALAERADHGGNVAAIEALARRGECPPRVSAGARVGLGKPPERPPEGGCTKSSPTRGTRPPG